MTNYLKRLLQDSGANQSREVGMMQKSSDFDEVVLDRFTQMASNPAKSEKQARFMRACAHGAGYSSCPSKSVARKFMH